MARTLDLAALRSFVTIAEMHSVTQAAGRLNLTQSAVSMQLKRLEDALGHPLFDRSRRAMTTTAHGELLLSYAHRMLAINDDIMARMTDYEFEGELRVGSPTDVVFPHVPHALRTFKRLYPRVRVSLQSSFTNLLKAELAKGALDLILTTEMLPDRRGRTLKTSKLKWVGAPGGRAAAERPLPLAFERDCICRAWVCRALDDAGIPWRLVVDTNSLRAVQGSVLADFAVHVGLDFTISPEFELIDDACLPPLPATQVAMYVCEGQNAAMAERLADIMCDTWAEAPRAAEPLALAAE
ncbi:MAG: LysR family transcriptional regulator [Pseudomonadota bacterium]